MIDNGKWLAVCALFVLAGCAEPPPNETSASSTAAQPQASLAEVIAGEHRTPAYRQRDEHRNPLQTLEFFGLEPDMSVAEIWPTMGWYAEIIAPFVKDAGRYYAVHFPADHSSAFIRGQRSSFEHKMASAPETYGDVAVTSLAKGNYDIAPPGSLDLVLTFRNVHNWTMQDYGADVFAAMFAALKPGGVLGVVEHRGEPKLPGVERPTGYVREEDVIALAEAAGFVFDARTEVNANPADTKDHPMGVWTLPPSLLLGPNDYERYLAIGESDRMTLRFSKPAQ